MLSVISRAKRALCFLRSLLGPLGYLLIVLGLSWASLGSFAPSWAVLGVS